MGIENREHARTGKPFVVELQIKPSESIKVFPSGWNVAPVKNLSAGGVLLYYNEDLEVGSLVDLKIFIPESTNTIKCAGQVIRIENNVNPGIYDVVVKFITINEQAKEILNNAVEESLI